VNGAVLNLIKNKEVCFFVWVKAGAAGDKIRLNIKDDLATSPQPYGFYSRADYTFPDNTNWYPIFTRTKLPTTINVNDPGQYNLVIHNIGPNSTTIKFTLPFLCIAVAENQDITMGASPDNPYLTFGYNNTAVPIVAP
jgi:hypothetical protein